MRSLLLTMAVLLAAGLAAPAMVSASCARTLGLAEVATQPGVAVFTGRATGFTIEGQHVVFEVDRWFAGPHAARVVRLDASTAFIGDATGGAVGTAYAQTISGDAIQLAAEQPVLIVAAWWEATDTFGVSPCTVAGVPLETDAGRAALSDARAVFGAGTVAADLPDTDAVATAHVSGAGPAGTVRDWWPLLVAAAVACSIASLRRRVSASSVRGQR